MIVFVVLVDEVVEVEVVVAAFRPRGDFFVGDAFSVFAESVLDAAVVGFLAGLLGVTGFSSFRLADLGLPLAAFVVPFEASGVTFSSAIGEGLRLRPGDFRVPLRVALSTSWLDARVVRLLSILECARVLGSRD